MIRLEEQRDKGTSIILITHDMQLVAEYSDHVAVMNNGRLIFDGVPSDLFKQKPLLQQASLKEPPVCQIVSELIGSGIPISEKIITTDQFLKAFQILQRPLKEGTQ
jgi:energy-coupling factor transport system ATP-binding protein